MEFVAVSGEFTGVLFSLVTSSYTHIKQFIVDIKQNKIQTKYKQNTRILNA